MKIIVQREDGSTETVNLGDSPTVWAGQYLNRITTTAGCEYFFTHDGHYDGWGAGIKATEAEASVILDAMEAKRSRADA